MAKVIVSEKHILKAKSEPFTLSVEIDAARAGPIVLDFRRAGQVPKQFELVEADIAALEDLCASMRQSMAGIVREGT